MNKTVKRHNSKTPAQHEKAAKGIAAGKPIGQALVEAGWSEKQARKGKAIIEGSRTLQAAIVKEVGQGWEELVTKGANVTPETLQNAVMGRIATNLIQGTDAGTQTAKLAGQWKSLNMWQPEFQQGVIVINGGGSLAIGPEILDAPSMEVSLPEDMGI